MFEIVVSIVALAASALYVGYLAYAMRAIPLWIIVIVTFAIAIREFVIELRGSRTGRNGRNGRNGKTG